MNFSSCNRLVGARQPELKLIPTQIPLIRWLLASLAAIACLCPAHLSPRHRNRPPTTIAWSVTASRQPHGPTAAPSSSSPSRSPHPSTGRSGLRASTVTPTSRIRPSSRTPTTWRGSIAPRATTSPSPSTPPACTGTRAREARRRQPRAWTVTACTTSGRRPTRLPHLRPEHSSNVWTLPWTQWSARRPARGLGIP